MRPQQSLYVQVCQKMLKKIAVMEQGRIHGQYQSRTGGQGRKCVVSHFSTRSPRTNQPTNGRTDKASYRVASPRLKTKLTHEAVDLYPQVGLVDYEGDSDEEEDEDARKNEATQETEDDEAPSLKRARLST